MNMKKFILSALCAIGLVGTASAQDVFAKGDQFVNVGIGLASGIGSTTFPPLSVAYERGIVDNILENGSIGLGGSAEYRGYKYNGGLNSGLSLFVGPRASFHYQFIDNLDVYTGIGAGLYIYSHAVLDKASTYVGFTFDGHLGARYLLSERFGVFTEITSGIGTLRIGATINL